MKSIEDTKRCLAQNCDFRSQSGRFPAEIGERLHRESDRLTARTARVASDSIRALCQHVLAVPTSRSQHLLAETSAWSSRDADHDPRVPTNTENTDKNKLADIPKDHDSEVIIAKKHCTIYNACLKVLPKMSSLVSASIMMQWLPGRADEMIYYDLDRQIVRLARRDDDEYDHPRLSGETAEVISDMIVRTPITPSPEGAADLQVEWEEAQDLKERDQIPPTTCRPSTLASTMSLGSMCICRRSSRRLPRPR